MDTLTVLVVTAVAIETANLISLAWILIWTRRAGSRIVDSIAMRLGLRTGRGGKNPSPLDKLSELADRFLPAKGEAGEAPAQQEEAIDLGEFGSYTPSQIKGFAQTFGGKLKAGQATLPAGATMGALEGLMKGEAPKNIWEALPLIMSFLGPPGAAQSGGSGGSSQARDPNDTNNNW